MAPKKSKGDAHSLNTKLALVIKSGKGTCLLTITPIYSHLTLFA